MEIGFKIVVAIWGASLLGVLSLSAKGLLDELTDPQRTALVCLVVMLLVAQLLISIRGIFSV